MHLFYTVFLMKTFLILSVALTAALPSAAIERTDTLVHVERPEVVTVTKNDSLIRINVQGNGSNRGYRFDYTMLDRGTALVDQAADNWNFTLPFAKKKRSMKKGLRGECTALTTYLGFNRMIDMPAGTSGVFGGNFDAELEFLRCHLISGRNNFSLGWGYGWARYRLSSDRCFNFDGANVSIAGYPDGMQPVRSVFRLNRHVFSFNYLHMFDHKVAVTLGAALNVHVRPRIYNTYLRDGHSQRDTYKYNVPYAPIGFSLMGKISYDDFGFFVRYTPTSVFEKDRGPQFKSITVGVTFF